MNFGYFTLSDNRYPDNERTPEQFVKEIYEQCLWADRIGLHSAWVGEHHFNLLGVNSAPHILLSQLAGATQRIRLAPAIVVLPIHHPLLVAEEWATLDLLSGGRVDFAAGRGYDTKEYQPLGVSLSDSLEMFEEGMEILWRAWTSEAPISYHGKWYQFDDVDVRPQTPSKAAAPLCRELFATLHGDGGQKRLEHHLRPLCRRHDVRQPRRCGQALSRHL